MLQSGPRHWFAWLCSLLPPVARFGRSAAQILQNGPRQLGLLGCAPCSPSGGPFWPLSSPNPPKRTSPARSAWLAPSGGPFWPLSSPNPPKRTLPAWSAWLCSVLSLGGPFCPNPPKRTSPCWSAWLSSLLSLMVVRFGRSAAQILQNGPRQLGLLGCAPCSSSGGPFWPLSSPNPSTRTSPALPTSSVSVPFSPWCSVLST